MDINLRKYYFIWVIFLLLTCVSTTVAQEDIIRVANFRQELNGLPSGWQVKEWKGRADIRVVSGDAGKALCLKSNGTSTALYRDLEIDIKNSPYIIWQWKVTKLPKGGDVRKSSTDDQAAQIYAIFPKFPSQINSRAIGYIWDTTAPQGSVITSTKFSKAKYIVLRSGQNSLGEWLREKRNIYEDYKMLFGEEPPKIGRIGVMIDSDDTKSNAESFFGEIYLSKN